jgi:hypothetical protein
MLHPLTLFQKHPTDSLSQGRPCGSIVSFVSELKVEPPGDADVAEVLQKISRRVIRMLLQLGYLEAGMDVPVVTGYDPLLDNEP